MRTSVHGCNPSLRNIHCVPWHGEESGGGGLTREDLDRLFEDSDDEMERESVGKGRRRRRGF